MIYRCSLCRTLIVGSLGHGGELCPTCETPGSKLVPDILDEIADVLDDAAHRLEEEGEGE